MKPVTRNSETSITIVRASKTSSDVKKSMGAPKMSNPLNQILRQSAQYDVEIKIND